MIMNGGIAQDWLSLQRWWDKFISKIQIEGRHSTQEAVLLTYF